jgi:hypothetical protein
MIIQRLFSKKDSNKTRNSVIAGSGLIGIDAALSNLNNKNVDKLEKKWKEEAKKDKESKKVYRKLRKNFKRPENRTILEEGKDIGGNIIRENQSGIIEEGPKKGYKIVQISGKTKGNASVLGHELGHLHYLSDSKADKVGRYAHKLSPISNNSTLIGLGFGVASGIGSAKKEEMGEKEGALGRSSGIIAATGSYIPRIVAEGKASQHGYKLMKNAGASDRLLKSAKKNYKGMLLTYGSGIAANAGISELGRAAGRAYYNNTLKEKNNDNSKK